MFPITGSQFNPIMDGVVQLNVIDGALNEPQQRAIGIYLHVFDLYVKSGGKIDYRGVAGHERLKQDAMTFCGSGNPCATRHGDLAAVHLAIDFHDTAVRCKAAGLPLPPATASQLVANCRDLTGLTIEMEKRVGILLDFLGKKPAV